MKGPLIVILATAVVTAYAILIPRFASMDREVKLAPFSVAPAPTPTPKPAVDTGAATLAALVALADLARQHAVGQPPPSTAPPANRAWEWPATPANPQEQPEQLGRAEAPPKEVAREANRRMNPEERIQEMDRRRANLTKQYGKPVRITGRVKQQLGDGLLVVRGNEGLGTFVLDSHPQATMLGEGTVIDCEAWSVGLDSFIMKDSSTARLDRMIFAVAPLPRWDKYGRPINRNGVETPDEVYGATSDSLHIK